MTNKEKIEKFKTFKQGLQILPYTNPKEMEYYHKVIATHLKEITTQRELNLNQYFDTENQRKDRQKLFDAIKYIEAVEDLI